MADDLKLEIVIQALLDAKGFEEAKQNLEGVTATANRSAPAVRRAGDAAKQMGASYGGTRGPVADVTRVLLMNVGVTGAAGEAAKAAGTAMYFLEGAASATAVAISGGVAAIAVLLPMLVRWIATNDELSTSNQGVESTLGKLSEAIDQAGQATRNLVVALHAAELQKEKTKLAEMREEVANYTENMRKLGQTMIDSPSIIALREQIGLYEQAHAAGLTYAESLQEAKKSNEDFKISFDELNRSIRESIEEQKKLRAEQRKRDFDQEIDAIVDMHKVTDRAAKERKKAADAEAKRQVAQMEADEEERKRLELLDEQKRINAIHAIGYAGTALSALSVLFRGNKALAIASAIADTYAGAALALRTIPPPAGWVAAAATIAQGLAAVDAIRKAEPIGFDDPFADMTARQLGRKSAVDFVQNFGLEFIPGVRRGMGGMGGVTNHTTINRGTNNITVNGVIGSKAETRKYLARELQHAQRLERRTTIGR